MLKIHEQDKKHVDELARERDILNKNFLKVRVPRKMSSTHSGQSVTMRTDHFVRWTLLKASAATSKQLDLVRLHEQNKKNLEQEIASYRDESAKQRKIIFQLEKEREKYINETSDLNHRIEYRNIHFWLVSNFGREINVFRIKFESSLFWSIYIRNIDWITLWKILKLRKWKSTKVRKK